MKLSKVTWLDAADNSDIPLSDLKKKNPKEWLVKRTTFGHIIKKTNTAIVLIRDFNEDEECEITAIPRGWVVEIEDG